MTRMTLAVAAALAAAAGPVAAGPIVSVTSNLTATPAVAVGACPQTITFNGAVVVKVLPGAGAKFGVQFQRSDGAIAPISYFTATGPVTTHPVSDTWTLGGASLPTYAGWERVKVMPVGSWYPVTYSNRAEFKMECRVRRQGPAPRP